MMLLDFNGSPFSLGKHVENYKTNNNNDNNNNNNTNTKLQI